jgi:hypothetical protein
MGEAAGEFGLPCLDVRALIEWARADLGSSNAGVRNGAIALLAAMHRQLGASLAPMLSAHVKPALMTTLDAAFKANPQTQVRLAAAAACTIPPPCPVHLMHALAHATNWCFSGRGAKEAGTKGVRAFDAGGADTQGEGQGGGGGRAGGQEAGGGAGSGNSGCGCA